MNINSVEFKGSFVHTSQCPQDNLPEILVSGRSNVGKSSFINSLLNRKNIAHISGKPGKTQTLNFYNVNEDFYLVDVPGYGYAAVSKTEKEKFGEMIEEYLLNRPNLRMVILLVDFRHRPSKDDLLMYNFLRSYAIPCLVVGTKQDKIPKTQQQKHIKEITSSLALHPDDLFISYSSVSRINRDQILEIIQKFTNQEE